MWSIPDIIEKNIKQGVEEFEKDSTGAKIFLKEVPDPERFGVATINEEGKVTNIVEKPKQPESNLAITGLYFLDRYAFDFAKNLKPSARGELEITDILNAYLKNSSLSYNRVEGYWSDMGTIPSLDRTATFVKENKAKLDDLGRFKNYRFRLGHGEYGDYLR